MTLCACQRDNNYSLLCKNGYRYWRENNGNGKEKVSIHYFDKDGQWLLFEGCTKGFYETGYELSLRKQGKWNFLKDNVMEIAHKRYSVISMGPSLIVLQREGKKAQLLFSPMKAEEIPDNYKMLWK